MKIYIYSENCQGRGGRIYRGTDEEAESCGDCWLWGEGTEDQLIAEALKDLSTPCDRAPHYRHKCAMNVLVLLNGPEVAHQLDPKRGSYWEPASVRDRLKYSPKKEFIVRDLTGRGVTASLSLSQFAENWDLDFVKDPDDEWEQPFGEWLELAEVGDEYTHDEEVCVITRIS
jgi:hypothetical protein